MFALFVREILLLPSFIAVGLGAALGAWIRWGLTAWLNPLNTQLPLGTLGSNLIGGIVSSTLLTLLVLPTLYRLLHRGDAAKPQLEAH